MDRHTQTICQQMLALNILIKTNDIDTNDTNDILSERPRDFERENDITPFQQGLC